MQKWDYYTKFNLQDWPGCCGRTQFMRGSQATWPLFWLQLSPSPGLVKILPREPSAEQPGSPHPSQSFLVDAEGNWLSRSWGLVFLDGARWGSNLQGPCLPAKRRNCPWPEALSISADLRSCLLTLALRQSLTGSLLLCVILCFFLHQVFV